MRDALKELPGVTNVQMDYPNKTFYCSVEDKENFDTDGAVSMIKEMGEYTVTTK